MIRRSLVVLDCILLAAKKDNEDKRIRSVTDRIDRIKMLAEQYGERERVMKDEIDFYLSSRVIDAVLRRDGDR